MVGFIIGLVIGIGLLFLVIGFINGVLGDFLWKIEPREGFLNTLFHGLVLSVIFLLVNVATYYLPIMVFPHLATQIVAFVITTPIDGAIGKHVASWFGEEPLREVWEETAETSQQPSGLSYIDPAPTVVSEDLPVCPLCKNRTKWKASYPYGLGVKGYSIMCGVCHAEWENVRSEPFIRDGLAGPVPLPLTPAEDRFALRKLGENIGPEIFLNREITLSNWREMIDKFCEKCGAPLAKDEDSCPKCRSEYRSGHHLVR